MDIFNFSVAVGAAHPITYPGTYVRYRRATAGSDFPEILVKADTGDQVKLLPGQGMTFQRRFGRVDVYNEDAVLTIAGELIVGEGQFEDGRVQGEVSVIDGGRLRSLGASAYTGYLSNSGGVGTYGYVQLFNPAGSGVNAYVQSICAWSTDQAGGLLRIASYDTQLTDYVGVPNKRMGGAASAVRMCYGSDAAGLGTTLQYFSFERVYEERRRDYREPLLLVPGKGILVGVLATNKQTGVLFELFTEPSS